MQIEQSAVLELVPAEMNMFESTFGLTASGLIHVEVQQAEAMVAEPTVTEPILFGFFPKKPVVEEQVPSQVTSATLPIAESAEALVAEPTKPVS